MMVHPKLRFSFDSRIAREILQSPQAWPSSIESTCIRNCRGRATGTGAAIWEITRWSVWIKKRQVYSSSGAKDCVTPCFHTEFHLYSLWFLSRPAPPPPSPRPSFVCSHIINTAKQTGQSGAGRPLNPCCGAFRCSEHWKCAQCRLSSWNTNDLLYDALLRSYSKLLKSPVAPDRSIAAHFGKYVDLIRSISPNFDDLTTHHRILQDIESQI